MLLDSNIIIYAAQPKAADLRAFIAERSPAVSAISVVEVLGYHKLTAEEREDFDRIGSCRLFQSPISNALNFLRSKKLGGGETTLQT